MCMCKSSSLVRITFFFSSLIFPSLCVSFFARSFLLVVVHVKVALELLKYIHTQRERIQAVVSFFLIPFRVTVQSYMYTCVYDQWMGITSHTNTRTHTHIHHQEKRSKLEATTKTCSNFYSLSLLFFPPMSRVMTTIFHCLFFNFSFGQINRTKEGKKNEEWPSSTNRIEFSQYFLCTLKTNIIVCNIWFFELDMYSLCKYQSIPYFVLMTVWEKYTITKKMFSKPVITIIFIALYESTFIIKTQ